MKAARWVSSSSPLPLLAAALLAAHWLGSVGMARAAEFESARTVIESAGDQMLKLVEERRPEFKDDPALVYKLVEDVLLPHFDFGTIARLVLGKYWRTATAEQRTEFSVEFRTLLVRSYATAFLEYEGQEIRFLPSRPTSRPDRSVVRLELIDPSTAPVTFTYSLHNVSGPWLVYDVAVDGVSLLTNYRVSIATNIKTKGLDSIIAELEDRNIKAVRSEGK